MTTPANDKKPPRKKKKLKKIELEAKAQRKGEILAEYTAHKKKPWQESLKEHIGRAIDRLDPMESIAIVGMTVIVKGLIDTVPSLKTATSPFTAAAIAVTQYVSPALSGMITTLSYAEMGVAVTVEVLPDWAKWLLAFSIAYVIVRHGGQLLGLMKEGAGTLTNIVGALMGVAV